MWKIILKVKEYQLYQVRVNTYDKGKARGTLARGKRKRRRYQGKSL
jgi:hypothetical protein